MATTSDQQKTIYSLIENSLSSEYEEIQDELYDHFLTKITALMKNGFSFTDAINTVYNDLGGQPELLRIEASYIAMIKKQGKALYKQFASQYFMSFHWLIPILLGVLVYIIPFNKLPFPFIAINILVYFLVVIYGTWYFKRWRLEGEYRSFKNEKKNLKAIIIFNYYVRPLSSLSLLIFAFNHTNSPIITFLTTVVLYIVVDYSLSFLKYMKHNWLLSNTKYA